MTSHILKLCILIPTLLWSQTHYPITIKNELRSVTIKKEPQRIISLAPAITEMLYALGAGSKLIGRTSYCDFPDSALSVKTIGNLLLPDIEIIVSLNPDLVIASTHYRPTTLFVLQNAGIPVIAFPTPKRIEDIYTNNTQMGRVLNKTQNAELLNQQLRSKINSIQQLTDSITITKRPTVYYSVATGRGGEYTPGRGTYLAQLISICGGNNIAEEIDGWRYNLENLIQKNPEIIIGDSLVFNTMKFHPNYRGLSAITNNSFYIIDSKLYTRMSPRLILEGADILLQYFQPTLYTKKYSQ